MEQQWFYGAIHKEDPRDYKLGGDTGIEIPEAFNTETHEYNQLEFSKIFWNNLCTLYWPTGSLSDLIGRFIEWADREELCKKRTSEDDWDASIGGYWVVWVNCVRHWWNDANPNNQIRQFNLTKEQFMEALIKGHRPIIGYRGNSAYNLDASDGVLDSVDIWKTTYGHFTTVKFIDGEFVVDNYKWVKTHNTYKIADFEAFIDSDITFPSYYLYLFASDAMDAQIALLKDKWKDERPDITFNADKIKEYKEMLSKRKNFYS